MKYLQKVSLIILVLSILTYAIGRTFARGIVTDDVGDWFLWSGGISAIFLFFTVTGNTLVNIRSGINIVAGCIIFLLVAFGLWGMFTSAGRKEFPELAGLIPFYSLLAAGITFLVLIILNIVWSRYANRKL